MKTLTKLTLSVLVTMAINMSTSAYANYPAGLDSFPTWPAKSLSKFEPVNDNSTFATRFENTFFFKNLVKKSPPKKGQ